MTTLILTWLIMLSIRGRNSWPHMRTEWSFHYIVRMILLLPSCIHGPITVLVVVLTRRWPIRLQYVPIGHAIHVSWYISHGRNCCAHRRCNSDAIGIVVCATLDMISWRQKSIEALDKLRVAIEEGRHSINNARRINSVAFEVLHDVQKLIVDIRMILEPYLDLI